MLVEADSKREAEFGLSAGEECSRGLFRGRGRAVSEGANSGLIGPSPRQSANSTVVIDRGPPCFLPAQQATSLPACAYERDPICLCYR